MGIQKLVEGGYSMASNVKQADLRALVTLVEEAIKIGSMGTDTVYTSKCIVTEWVLNNDVKIRDEGAY